MIVQRLFQRTVFWLVIISSCFVGQASAQLFSKFFLIRFDISGETPDASLKFSGRTSVDLTSRKGDVLAKTTAGANCRGDVNLDPNYLAGTGSLKCNDGITATFRFKITKIRPISGEGSGMASDGRVFSFKLKRSQNPR